MNSDCHFLNPLRRDGTSQQQRMVEALEPTYAQIDERELSDYLTYIGKYAELLQYYAPNNTKGGNWEPFVAQDITALAAKIAQTDYQQLRGAFRHELRRLGRETGGDKIDALENLYVQVVSLARTVAEWHEQAIDGMSLQRSLEEFICSNLRPALDQLASYIEQAETVGMNVPDLEALAFDVRCGEETSVRTPSLFASGVNDEEVDAAAGRLSNVFERYYEVVVHLVRSAPSHLQETLERHASHHPHMALLLTFIQLLEHARQHLNTITGRHLDFYYKDVLHLQQKPETPDRVHVVFDLAQHTDEHRLPKDTFLKAGKDALGVDLLYATDNELIVNRAKVAKKEGLKSIFVDKSLTTAELARHLGVAPSKVEDVILEETKASKVPERLGPEMMRTVARALGLDLEDAGFIGEGGLGPHAVHNIYAAPQADSADGRGADLETEDGKWDTFGGPHMPTAEVGFAVASPMLLLGEGRRTVTMTFTFDAFPDAFVQLPKKEARRQRDELLSRMSAAEIAGGGLFLENTPLITTLRGALEDQPIRAWTDIVREELTHNVEVYFSGSEEWIQGSIASVAIDEQEAALRFTVLLSPEEPGVAPYDAEVLGGGFGTEEPVMKFVLDNDGFSARRGDFDLALVASHDVFAPGQDYTQGSYVQYGTAVFRALSDITGAEAHPHQSDDWEKIGAVEAYDEKRTYSREAQEYVWYRGELYRPVEEGVRGLLPDRHPDQWEKIERSYPYKYFHALELNALDIQVEVEGATALLLENELGVLNPAKPFQPFGPRPRKGSSFYIGSAEVFQKKIDALDLEITWGDLPEDESFADYYSEYGDKAPSDNDFTAAIQVLEGGTWETPSLAEGGKATAVPLFTGADAPDPQRKIALEAVLSGRESGMTSFSGFRTGLSRGFLRVNLNERFLHREYPKVLAEAAKDEDASMPNEPYTPLVTSLTLNYTATERVDFERATTSDFEQRVEQFFHIHPFGQAEFYPLKSGPLPGNALARRKLVPAFDVSVPVNDQSHRTTAEGTLQIGLQGLEPPQNVSVLFQVAEGSADPTLGKPDVVWSYLSQNEWTDLEPEDIVADRTNGLQTSGIITFAMPEAMTDTDTILPSGLHWIKASVARNSAGVARLIAVRPQAVRASFRDRGNDPGHVKNGLSAGTIGKLKERRSAIAEVAQPFASFGGRMKEQDPAYYTRVSERLRHKQRAVTIFDYERLVLEAFPGIYKVQCLNHTSDQREFDAGQVKVIVVPDLRNKNAVDPLRPRVSLNTLDEIQEHLDGLSSGFVTPVVKNPTYEQVRSDFKVKFQPGRDKGYYLNQLDRDIVTFLSPWLYEEGEDLPFGGRIHRSWVLNFVEERSYVDYVTDFRLNHITEEQTYRDVEEAAATTSSSVLVSASSHRISDIE